MAALVREAAAASRRDAIGRTEMRYNSSSEKGVRMTKHGSRFAYLVGAVLLSSTAAHAQVSDADASAEVDNSGAIIVTAQRREQSLQDVPIAVSAFSQADIETRQVNSTLDLVDYVPNLIGHHNTAVGTANAYSMRGLSNTESIATFDAPVGTYVDDIYISRQGANDFALFDVERVEVLRGPKGTLFGRNSTGGAINVIMAKPKNELGGFAEIGYGRFNRWQLRASVDLPVVEDTLLAKISGYYIDSDDYVRNLVTGEKLNGEKNWGLRGAIRAMVSDTVTWDLSADYISNSNANLPHFYDPTTGKRITYTKISKKTPLGTGLVSTRLADNTAGNVAKSYSISSNLSVDLGDATLDFITGYRHLFQEFMTESLAGATGVTIDGVNLVSASTGSGIPLVNDSWHKQFSQEIKVSGSVGDMLDYVAGFYYINETNESDFANLLITASGSAFVNGDRVMSNDTEALAGYAQLDLRLTPALTVTAGIRYTDERKTIEFTPNDNPLPLTSSSVPFVTQDLLDLGIPVKQNNKVWTPRFALQYEVNDDVMLFASATRGFKSGGWNARAYSPDNAAMFTKETIWSYEAGVRSELLDRKLRLNLTGFYFTDYDQQLPGGGLNPLTGSITYLTRNVADMENYGLELEVNASPVDGLNLYWAAGYQKASFKNVNDITRAQQAACLAGTVTSCNLSIVTPDGQIAEPTRAPKFSSTLGFSYKADLGNGLTLTPSANWRYLSKTWVSTSNDPRGLQKAHSIVNAGLSLKTDSGWSVGVECNNCFRDVYMTSFLIYPYLNDPGRWSIKVRREF